MIYISNFVEVLQYRNSINSLNKDGVGVFSNHMSSFRFGRFDYNRYLLVFTNLYRVSTGIGA